MSAEGLLALTAELVAIPSVSRDERVLADRIESDLRSCPWLSVTRVGDNVLARTDLGRATRVVVAGHLDTVPPAGNERPVVEDDRVSGVGAADMKGGLAVMLTVARALAEPSVDLTWCFYAREEVARSESGLLELWEASPELLAADAAVLCEPTGALVEAGCQGTMRAEIHMGGVRAHTARPFTGRNAIHRLAPILDQVSSWPGRAVVLDECEFTEQLQAVGVSGGVAGNVVPDGCSLTVNYRFAPDRRAHGAVEMFEGLFDGLLEPDFGDALEIVDMAEGAPPNLDHPLLARLVTATGEAPRAKVGFTDVATFFSHGIPAANFGPGDPLIAHRPEEWVSADDLRRARDVLVELLSAPS